MGATLPSKIQSRWAAIHLVARTDRVYEAQAAWKSLITTCEGPAFEFVEAVQLPSDEWAALKAHGDPHTIC